MNLQDLESIINIDSEINKRSLEWTQSAYKVVEGQRNNLSDEQIKILIGDWVCSAENTINLFECIATAIIKQKMESELIRPHFGKMLIGYVNKFLELEGEHANLIHERTNLKTLADQWSIYYPKNLIGK